MPSESRKKKLEMLTRSIASGEIARAEEILSTIGVAPAERAPKGADAPPVGPIALAEVAPGAEASNERGRYWLIRRSLAELSGDELAIQRQYSAVLRGARQRLDELETSVALCHVADGTPEGPLFFDLETCGLAGCPIFLVGMMTFRDEELIFEQLLARDYSEEAAILVGFAQRLGQASTLISFNGKSFDMTMLRDRSAVHKVDLPEPPPHCDLLHESRRRWRKDLPNCRLQTLERYLCKRRRVGDIPGAEIPEAYHRFVRTGDATEMKAILHHNLLDLLTMSQLLTAVLTGEAPDLQP